MASSSLVSAPNWCMECHGLQFPSWTQIFSLSYCHDKLNIPPYYFCGGGQGGGRPGEKGAGGVWEAGKRGQEAGFPRWQEAGEKGELCNIVQYLAIEKMQRGVSQ